MFPPPYGKPSLDKLYKQYKHLDFHADLTCDLWVASTIYREDILVLPS